MDSNEQKSAWNLVFPAFIIVILLAVISSTNYHSHEAAPASFKTSKIQINNFMSACRNYAKKTQQLPKSLNDLVSNPKKIKGWQLFLEEIPNDPWGNPYIFINDGNFIIISSGGASPESKDDIMDKKSYEGLLANDKEL